MKQKSFVLPMLFSMMLVMASCSSNENKGTTNTETETTSEITTSEEATSVEETTEDDTFVGEKVKVKAVDASNANLVSAVLDVGTEFQPGPAKITIVGGVMLDIPTYGGPGFTEKNISRIFVVINGENYSINKLPNSDEEKISQIDVDVIIPEEDFNVFVHYQTVATNDEGFNICIDQGEHVQLVGFDLAAKYKNFNAFLAVDDGYLIDSAFYRIQGEENWNTLKATLRGDLKGIYYNFIIGNGANPVAGNVELKIVTGEHEKYNITYNVDPNLTINEQSSVLPAEAFDSLTVNLSIYLNNSTLFVVSSLDCEVSGSYGSYSFVMPKKDVVINIEEKEADVDLSIKPNSDIINAFFLNEDDYYGGLKKIEKGVSGTTVYLFVVADGAHKPVGVTIGDATLNFKYKGKGDQDNQYVYGSAVALAEDATSVEAEIIVAGAYLVSVDEELPSEAIISVAGSPVYAAGETVNVSFDTTKYNLVVKTASDGEVIEITLNDYISRSKVVGKTFVMPEMNVFLTLVGIE